MHIAKRIIVHAMMVEQTKVTIGEEATMEDHEVTDDDKIMHLLGV